MDPATARELALKWEGATFGIDQHAWSVGPKFKGIKMIPPGPHYISYGASDTFGTSATTISFFTFIEPEQIIVKKWDTTIEDFVDLINEERERYAEGVRRFDFDSGLGAFPQEKLQDWTKLSSLITKKLVKQLEPSAKKISSAASSTSLEEERQIIEQINNFQLKNTENKQTQKQDTTEPPPLESADDSTTPNNDNDNNNDKNKETQTIKKENTKTDLSEMCPKFTTIPKRVAEKGATPQEITQQNLDKSVLLKKILETRYPSEPIMLLGELQYAFAAFFYGHSFEGFRQWKELLIILTSSESLLIEKPDFFVNFIDVALPQMDQVPEDFFYDNISGNNFLKQIFKGFFENLIEQGIDRALANKGKLLQISMEKRFKISFAIEDFEDEEDAPVLVMLDE